MTEVIVLTREGCNPCARVKRILAEIGREVPQLTIREVSMDSEEGTALALEHSVLFPPAVLANGALLAKGKVLEEPLRAALGAKGQAKAR